MKRLLLAFLSVLHLILLGGCQSVGILNSAGNQGQRLPPCPGVYKQLTWTNCAGTITYANGDMYVGEFGNGNPNGQGIHTYGPSSQFKGDKYVGEFKDRNHEGQGTYTFANGNKYVGEFKDNKPHGQGAYTFGPSSQFAGDKYVGGFKDNKFHGQGTYNHNSGSEYIGEFKDNKRHGQGSYTFANGNKYVGIFKNNERDGQGTFYFLADNKFRGDKYVGEFKDGKLSGLGIYAHANGNKYVGEIKGGKRNGQGIFTFADGRVLEGKFKNDKFEHAEKVSSEIHAKNTLRQPSENTSKSQLVKAPEVGPSKSPSKSRSSGSGFFVSKQGHVVTNEHVVKGCKSVTVGDDVRKQSPVSVIEVDRRNDLALLKLPSSSMASAETRSLISKLDHEIAPLLSGGFLRSKDVTLGERVLVSGYPYGESFDNNINVTGGIVSSVRGKDDDSGQFQMDAAVQPGDSGGPIYDKNGNIVGVVFAQLDKLKVTNAISSIPENGNLGIKASTVRQFLTSSGLETKWSNRSKSMPMKELAKIAISQTVLVTCHR